MTKGVTIRRDSAAHRALCRLVELGGKAASRQLIAVMSPEFRSLVRFQQKVTERLEMAGLAVVKDAQFAVTPAGRDFVARTSTNDVAPAEKYVGQVAQPRVYGADRPPLALAKHMGAMPYRVGSQDHLAIPSLMGEKRILPGGQVVGSDSAEVIA